MYHLASIAFSLTYVTCQTSSVVKSFEVLAKISNDPAKGEETYTLLTAKSELNEDAAPSNVNLPSNRQNPMNDDNANFALGILEPSRRKLLSRDRSVFASLIDLHSKHQKLLNKQTGP